MTTTTPANKILLGLLWDAFSWRLLQLLWKVCCCCRYYCCCCWCSCCCCWSFSCNFHVALCCFILGRRCTSSLALLSWVCVYVCLENCKKSSVWKMWLKKNSGTRTRAPTINANALSLWLICSLCSVHFQKCTGFYDSHLQKCKNKSHKFYIMVRERKRAHLA